MEEGLKFQVAGGGAAAYETFVAPIMAPFVTDALEAAGIPAGGSVLDVACGTGFVARSAAALVGPTGRVAGVDLNPGMLRTASAGADGIEPRIHLYRSAADRLPFADSEFDAVICQQGLQFFPDPAAAVAEAARVLVEGGRYVVTVWSGMAKSPYMQAQHAAISEALGPDAGASFTKAFECSADAIVEAFHGAGLRNPTVREVEAHITLNPAIELVAGHLGALPWGAAIAAAGPEGLSDASALIIDRLGGICADGSITATITSVAVSAER
ncbi:MAG: methyltransferase domain-containing protein [Acidimicrobiia bacterium]|nr:methyltransferase domain-containing protein [Acidimicrobiia bacterium]